MFDTYAMEHQQQKKRQASSAQQEENGTMPHMSPEAGRVLNLDILVEGCAALAPEEQDLEVEALNRRMAAFVVARLRR